MLSMMMTYSLKIVSLVANANQEICNQSKLLQKYLRISIVEHDINQLEMQAEGKIAKILELQKALL